VRGQGPPGARTRYVDFRLFPGVCAGLVIVGLPRGGRRAARRVRVPGSWVGPEPSPHGRDATAIACAARVRPTSTPAMRADHWRAMADQFEPRADARKRCPSEGQVSASTSSGSSVMQATPRQDKAKNKKDDLGAGRQGQVADRTERATLTPSTATVLQAQRESRLCEKLGSTGQWVMTERKGGAGVSG